MILRHENYIAQVDFDEEAGLFTGQVINLTSPVTFAAKDADGLMAEFRKSIETYLAVCAERGIEPEKAFSGKFVLRAGVELHRNAVVAAARAGKSLNTWLVDTIEKALEREGV